MKTKGITTVFLVLFILIWSFVIIADYINKHPLYEFSFEYFRYTNLLLYIFVISGFTSAIFLYPGLKPYKNWISNGAGLIILVMVVIGAISISFSGFAEIDFNINHLINVISINLASIGYLLLLTLSSFCIGAIILKNRLSAIYLIGVGLIVICNMLFVFGVFSFINKYTVLALLIIPILINYKKVPGILNKTIFKAYDLGQVNLLGTVSIVFILFFFMLNFMHSQTPFPTGFDSRNFYMNIAKLVSSNEGLIFGWRPYNWGLLISTGYTLFNENSIAISISMYGYLLCAFAIFYLGKKVLNLNVNYILFAILLVTVTPAIANQLFIEHKTDLALMFFQVISLSLFLELFGTTKITDDDDYLKNVKQISIPLIVLGLFLGFGLTIKMTNMFLVFAIIIGMFSMSKRPTMLAGVLALALALFLMAKLDDLTGLRKYHLSVNYVILGLTVIGSILLAISFARSRVPLLRTIRFAIIMGCFALIPLLPWMIKNHIETESFNPVKLLNGAQSGPEWNIRQIDRNYRQSKGRKKE